MAAVLNPQSSNVIEVCFLLTLNLKQVFCTSGYLFPKRLFKDPGVFFQHVASRPTILFAFSQRRGPEQGDSVWKVLIGLSEVALTTPLTFPRLEPSNKALSSCKEVWER